MAQEVGEVILGQEGHIFEIPQNYLRILFRIKTAINSRTLNTNMIANISFERYKALDQNVERIYEEAFSPGRGM